MHCCLLSFQCPTLLVLWIAAWKLKSHWIHHCLLRMFTLMNEGYYRQHWLPAFNRKSLNYTGRAVCRQWTLSVVFEIALILFNRRRIFSHGFNETFGSRRWNMFRRYIQSVKLVNFLLNSQTVFKWIIHTNNYIEVLVNCITNKIQISQP